MADCGGGLCGTVVWLKDPIDDGKTCRGSIALPSPTTLKVEGCMLSFCEAEVWTRTE